jgi:hypothetical protein
MFLSLGIIFRTQKNKNKKKTNKSQKKSLKECGVRETVIGMARNCRKNKREI